MVASSLGLPEGYKLGCKPRVSRYGQWCDKAEDRIDIYSEKDLDELIHEGAGLSDDHIGSIFSQGRVGSCATEAAGQGHSAMRISQGEEFVLFNPWSVYAFVSGGRDRGSSIDECFRHIRDVGIMPESEWPRSKGWRAKPPQSLLDTVAVNYRNDEYYDIGSIPEVQSCLIEGMCVAFGYKAHSELLLRLLTPDTAFCINSWGEDWGDNGTHIIRLKEINFGYGAIVNRSVFV